MVIATFKARCPFEIGDRVSCGGTTAVIEDIRCIHYLKSGEVEFEAYLEGEGFVSTRILRMEEAGCTNQK